MSVAVKAIEATGFHINSWKNKYNTNASPNHCSAFITTSRTRCVDVNIKRTRKKEPTHHQQQQQQQHQQKRFEGSHVTLWSNSQHCEAEVSTQNSLHENFATERCGGDDEVSQLSFMLDETISVYTDMTSLFEWNHPSIDQSQIESIDILMDQISTALSFASSWRHGNTNEHNDNDDETALSTPIASSSSHIELDEPIERQHQQQQSIGVYQRVANLLDEAVLNAAHKIDQTKQQKRRQEFNSKHELYTDDDPLVNAAEEEEKAISDVVRIALELGTITNRKKSVAKDENEYETLDGKKVTDDVRGERAPAISMESNQNIISHSTVKEPRPILIVTPEDIPLHSVKVWPSLSISELRKRLDELKSSRNKLYLNQNGEGGGDGWTCEVSTRTGRNSIKILPVIDAAIQQQQLESSVMDEVVLDHLIESNKPAELDALVAP